MPSHSDGLVTSSACWQAQKRVSAYSTRTNDPGTSGPLTSGPTTVNLVRRASQSESGWHWSTVNEVSVTSPTTPSMTTGVAAAASNPPPSQLCVTPSAVVTSTEARSLV